MDTFPYESWDEALAAADGTQGYFTFGPGGNTASIVITVLAILLSVAFLVMVTMRETKHLNESATALSEKWGV